MGVVLAATLVGMLAVARAVCALGREHYVPPIFAVVSPKQGTPVFATAILGIATGASQNRSTNTFACNGAYHAHPLSVRADDPRGLAAMIALFTAFNNLVNLVSVCTLCTFTIVACGTLWRHYHVPGKTKPWLAAFAIAWFLGTSIGAFHCCHCRRHLRAAVSALPCATRSQHQHDRIVVKRQSLMSPDTVKCL